MKDSRPLSILLLITVLGVISVFSNAYVSVKLWEWFVVPLGVMPIGMALAVGLRLTIRFFTVSLNAERIKNPEKYKLSDTEQMGYSILTGIVIPGVALSTGWIVSLCM